MGQTQGLKPYRTYASASASRHVGPPSTRPGHGAGPRGRRRALVALLALLLVVVIVSIAGGAYAWSRPVPVTIVGQPEGCTIEVIGVIEGTSRVSLDDLDPGLYTVELARRGYATLRTTFVVERFSRNEYAWALEPRPQHLTIRAPSEATVRVVEAPGPDGPVGGSDAVAESAGTLDTTLPAGAYVVEVTQAGCNTYTREIDLDGETTIEVRLDPVGQLVHSLGMMEATGAPKGVAFTPDGSQVWTTILNGPPSVLVYDVASLRLIDEVALGGHGAVEVVFADDGTRAYASQMETALVYEIDTATREVLRTLDTESAWSKVVEVGADGSRLYVANWSGDDVSEIDLATGECVRRFRTGNTPRGLYATEDGTRLYVATYDGGELQRIDLATGEVTTLFDNNGALRHIVGDAERGLLYISDMRNDVVFVHDIASGETRKFVDTDEKPNTIDLSPDGQVLFVSCRGENNPKSYYIPGPEWGTILLFDTSDGSPLDAIVGGNQCTALAVSDDGSLLVFSDFLDDRLRLYQVPEAAALRAGDGGRWDQHFAELVK